MATATTDEYFPATNAFLRSLTEPEPAPRPPSTRSESAAASVNWRVADATERAATDRAGFHSLQPTALTHDDGTEYAATARARYGRSARTYLAA